MCCLPHRASNKAAPCYPVSDYQRWLPWLTPLPRITILYCFASGPKGRWPCEWPRLGACLAVTWTVGFRSMLSNLTAGAECRACVIKLRHIGDAESKVVETQSRTEIPLIGEVIEVSLNGVTARARVVQIDCAGVEGAVAIQADELSSSYVLDTFIALAQNDAEEARSKTSSLPPSRPPHLAFEATVSLVRQCHALAWRFLDRPKPDLTSALRYMRVARRAAWLAFPYIQSDELRRRIVGYKPMSQAEWERLWPPPTSELRT